MTDKEKAIVMAYTANGEKEGAGMNKDAISLDEIKGEIEKLYRLQKDHKEQELAEIITKYDFIVGSKECKHKLMEILPEGADIICSPYIEDSTTIYAIKKFDARMMV